jgi:hypothetical protein
MNLNILMQGGKIYLDGETIGEFDTAVGDTTVGDSAETNRRIADLKEGETIQISLPFERPRITREWRQLLQSLDFNVPRYGPCIDCGNPAKNCLCFKCNQKRVKRDN